MGVLRDFGVELEKHAGFGAQGLPVGSRFVNPARTNQIQLLWNFQQNFAAKKPSNTLENITNAFTTGVV